MPTKNRLQTFEQFVASQNIQIEIFDLVTNLGIAAILSLILSYVYTRFGTSISNRKSLSKNFLMLTLTTLFIITIVKSSLALSLGLVGALSIVRFRTAIKEPEELNYLFFSIAIGLGLGANQSTITIAAFIVIVSFIVIMNFRQHSIYKVEDMFVTVSGNSELIKLDKIISILERACKMIELKRFDEKRKIMEAVFIVEFRDIESFQKSQDEIKTLDPAAAISILNNKLVI
jgi:hypothetical protein